MNMNLEPESFEFLVDVTSRDHVVLGFKVNVVDGSEYVIPMSLGMAHTLGGLLIDHADVLNHPNAREYAASVS